MAVALPYEHLWRAPATGFLRGFSALSGVLAALAVLFMMTLSVPSFGAFLIAAGTLAVLALGRLDGEGKVSWIDWSAGALVVVGVLWCVSEPWRGAPVQYTTLAFLAIAGSVLRLFGISPARTEGRRIEHWAGAVFGIAICVAAFWPWIVAIVERGWAYSASPTTGVGAEISAFWIMMIVVLLALLSIVGLILLMDRLIERRELRDKANG